ncbi:MAG: YceI family protein [Gemmatimonadaceae bacterium]|nr:YceI family protein [Gemmatimonadaceae bacterium]
MDTSERHLVLDATNTTITFEVIWFGVFPVRGRFTRVHGALHLDPGCITRAQVSVDVEAASLDTGIALRDRHLRGPRFLFAELHPFISFRSTAIVRRGEDVVVDGTLALRGRETSVRSTWPIGPRRAHALLDLEAEFTVSRRAGDVGFPSGIAGWNPLLRAIADAVRISVCLRVPAAPLVPVLAAAR